MQNTARIEALKNLEHPYFTNDIVEIEYLLGKIVSQGELIVGQGQAAFFVDSRYKGGCGDLTCVTLHNRSEEEREGYLKNLDMRKLGINPDSISLTQYRAFGNYDLEEMSPITKMRMIKDENEQTLIRESAALNLKAYNHLLDNLKEGMTEKEAAWIFESFARENGAERMAFGPTIAFGQGSAVPHYMTGNIKLKKGMPVLIDVGVVKNRYMSDMTRSFIFGGEDKEYSEIFQLVKMAQQEAVQMAKPGMPVKELDIHIRKRFENAGVLDAFKHSTGHGLGLEIHEQPKITYTNDPDFILLDGMVITIEPGLYFDGKWGIRYEDTIIINKQGVENLYDSNGNRTR